jgi:translocation and assembly module TamA
VARLLALLFLLLVASAARAEVEYEVELAAEGLPKDLRGEVEAASRLFTMQEKPPATEPALRRRAEEDLERLKPLVNGAGYWDAKLSQSIDFSGGKPKVTVTIEPGPLYTLESVTFRTPEGAAPPVLDRYLPVAVGLELGKPARSAPVLEAEGRIANVLTTNGRPYGKVVDKKVVIDHGTRTMAITYIVEPGPEAAFGATSIEGLTELEPAWVERRIEWTQGARYDSRTIDATRKALSESGLFSQIRINPAPEPAPDGSVPVRMELTERPRRSIGVGLSYNTSEGFGSQAFWEHRNLFGGAEKLRATVDLAQERLGGLLEFRKPDIFRARDTDLLLSTELADESPDAYDVQRLRLFGGFERKFSPSVTLGAGLAFEQEEVKQSGVSADYTLVSAPLFLRRDTTDDLLDPRQGTRLAWTLTPFGGIAGPAKAFVATRVQGSAYLSLDEKNRFTFATFAAVGTILGEDRSTIPADKRLYAGGGGSVRGYGYQRVGPLDADDDPIGGKGSLEAGVELRIRITETIGIAPFLEMGMVNDSASPIAKPFFGAGIGGRYFTALGPVRLDVGFPLNKRPSDDSFQIYVSLGQAF